MSSRCTRRYVFLCNIEDMSSCATRRLVFLCGKKTCPPAQQADMSLFLLHRKTCLLVQPEDMSSWCSQKTCLPAQREDLSACCTRGHVSKRHVFLLHSRGYQVVGNDVSINLELKTSDVFAPLAQLIRVCVPIGALNL